MKRAKIITPAASGDNEMMMAEEASRKMAELKKENEFLKVIEIKITINKSCLSYKFPF